jgi:hypothetical protein
MSKVIHLACLGRDLSSELAESVELVESFGLEWALEVARARRKYPRAKLIHPRDIPDAARAEEWLRRNCG